MNKFEKSLKDFAKKYYKDYSKDLFSMFIYRNFDFCNKNGYNALMTPFVWMFIKNYENLRSYIINNKSISSLIQLEYSAFSEATVPICTFVLSNFDYNYAGTYLKLSEFTGGMDVQNEKVLQIIGGDEILNDENKFLIKQSNFDKIPGSPIVYWAEKNIINAFEKGELLENLTVPRNGMKTGDNSRFIKYWWEINYELFYKNASSVHDAINSLKIYFPYNKGGEARKWYGNNDYVINWKNGGKIIFEDAKKDKRHVQNYPDKMKFSPSVTWSLISSGRPTFRFKEYNLSDIAGMSFYNGYEKTKYYLGFCNTPIAAYILKMLAPTINFQAGDIGRLPIFFNSKKFAEITRIVNENINISKNEWDSYELSWDFKKHPFLNNNHDLSNSFKYWVNISKKRFDLIHNNELLINDCFMDIYGITNKKLFTIKPEDITLRLSNLERDVKFFISYAVGCMFGRYSLDNEGLQFAGGEFNINNYHKFIPDDDNIIPVLDSEYFEDDIVGRFVEFIKTCFGEENLEENLDFIANALAKNKKTSREKIRDYLLKSFFNDHKKTYKKCPIYWQFSSGKENGFNCLIYMHRYEPNLVARIRTDYLHKTQKAIEQAIVNCDNIINHSSSNSEITKATKDKNKLQKQLKETQEYDEALAHIANQNIQIDLDDGVKVNYSKFQNVEVSKEGKKSKKINLLKKL